MEAKASHIEKALQLRSEGATLYEAAGLNHASAQVERLVDVAEGLAALPPALANPGARDRTRRAFIGEAVGYRTAWVHNHSVAHKPSRHPGKSHPFRWAFVVFLGVLLALFTGMGLALAAQLSEPDSALYPVRTLSERGLLAVTRGAVDKAGVHVDFADKRFGDAEAMAGKGKTQLCLDALSGYYDELRAATNSLGSVKVRDRKWIDTRNQLSAAEAKKIDIVEAALTASGHHDAALIVAERQKAFNTERQTLDKQLAVEAAKPAAPAVASPPPGG